MNKLLKLETQRLVNIAKAVKDINIRKKMYETLDKRAAINARHKSI